MNQLAYLVSEAANKFFIFSNLTNWHFSCRKSLNQDLISKYGELSIEEREALDGLKELLLKHNFGPGFLGLPFYTQNFTYSWQDFENYLEREEFKTLIRILEAFGPRWEEIWEDENQKLNQWKETLEGEGDKKTSQILKDLGILYSYVPDLEKFAIYLLISNQTGCGGGTNVGKNKITLECSGRDPSNRGHVVRVWGTFWHEFAHICSRKGTRNLAISYVKKADNLEFISAFKRQRPGRITFSVPLFFTEGIIHPVFGQGCLGKKYFNLDPERQFNQLFVEKSVPNYPISGQWGTFCAHKLSEEAARYLEEGKPLDEDFLNKIVETIREFLEIIQ